MIMAYSLAKSLRDTSNQDRWTEETVPKAAEYIEFTGDDNIGFTWVGNVDKSGDWRKTYRADLAMAYFGGTRFQPEIPVYSEDDDDESDYGDRRGNGLGATRGSSHGGPYGVSRGQGNPDILGATKTSSGWRSVDRGKDFRTSGRNGTSNRDDQNPYDPRLPMGTSDRHQLGSTNGKSSFDKQNFRKTKMGSSGQNLRYTQNPYGMTQLSTLREESERVLPGGSRPYDYTNPAELDGIATEAYDRKDGWKTMMANRNITDKIYRQFDQIKRRWAPSSGLSETGSVNKWDEQSTDTSSTETRSDSDDYDHKSLKKRCLVGFIILFVILVLTAAIVPAVVLTRKKGDSPDVMERIDMQAEINNFNFTPGLNDSNSDEYYEFTHTFCDQIIDSMAENNQTDGLVKDLLGCTVQSLSSGSVIVNFTVVIIHGGNNGPPTKTQVKILVGVGDGNTGTVNIGIFTIDVETFVVQAIVVVTAEDNPLPTMISYNRTCQPGEECETSFARCLNGTCACAQNRYYNFVNDSCLKDSGDSPDVMERIDMQAEINNFNFTPGLNDSNSDEYYEFTHTFCDQIIASMAENNQTDGLVKDLLGCTVQSLSSGSVIVNFTVVIIHGGNNGPPTKTQVKILVGVGDRNTGTVNIGIYTIDVETFVVQAIVVVTAEDNPLPTMISYNSTCQPGEECETSFAQCLNGTCACAQNRYYNFVNDSCLKVDCGQKPTVTHGATATSEGSLYGSILKVTCDEGYALPSDQNPFNVTCVNNNSWANLPGCSPISCGNYTAQIDSHILGYDPNSFVGSVFNENVTILCVDGYENPAEKTETCQSDGKWTSNVRCTAVSCGSFQAPDDSVIFENGIEYENTVNITCNPGYEIEGESSSTCQANRNWTSYGKCNPILCKTFEEVENSKNTSIVNDIRFNEPIIILCQDDHEYVGDTSLSCDENGDWPNISCVPVACSGTTNIDNGKISNASETTLIYQCNDGYETDDNTIVKCQNGQWDSLPVCTRKNCGQIATLINGNITYVDGTVFGDTAVVECDIGYELPQDGIIQCQSNGTWNYRPSCDKVYCDTFPKHAIKSSSTGYRFGDRVEIVCENGYRVIENISECQSNKGWVPDSVCQIQDCGNISIENGQIQDEANTTFGSVIFVACEDGFSIIGKEHVSCLETGEWDALPICNQSDCGNLTLPEQAYANGSIVECKDGYTLKDIKCHSNGSWEIVGYCMPISCNATDAPLNGNIENKTSSHVFQTKLTVMCNEGYQLNGSESIECLSSGTWSDIAECPPVTCLPFKLPNNSNFIEVNDQSKNTYMSNITIKCLTGYEMKGNANVTCQSNGTWTISPECVPVMCKNYTVPPNAHIAEGESPANYFNESITVICDLGYEYADSALTTDVCQSNKNWTTQVSCEPVSCGAFGETIEYAEMSQDGSNYGDNITVTCNTGYVLKGAKIIQCAENRSWSRAPTCEPINCTQLSEILPKNVAISVGSTNPFSYNNTVELVCKEGYETNSSTSVTCQADGNWTPFPECEAVSCGAFGETIMNAETSQYNSSYGDNITVTCNTGYALEGSGIIQCGADRSWSRAPTCEPINCTQLSEILPKNVAISVGSTNPFSYNNTVELVCKEGYETNSSTSVTCQADRNWTPFPECEAVSCGAFGETIMNAETSQYNSSYGDNITVTCNTGYALEGSGIIQCGVDKSWSNAPSCAPINCTHLSEEILPENLAISEGSANLFHYNITVDLACGVGYIINGTRSVTCQANGTWTNLPICNAIKCVKFIPPEFGDIDDSFYVGQYFKENVTIKCQDGFKMENPTISTAECQSNGTWTTRVKCVKINCGEHEQVTNGNLDGSDDDFNSTITISCDPGYALPGPNISTCQANKTWSEIGQCLPITCTNFDVVENSQNRSTITDIKYGEDIDILCNDGFVYVGKKPLTCSETGDWPVVNCSRVTCNGSTDIDHGSIVNTNETALEFKCHDGYESLSGLIVKCIDGELGTLPNCTKVDCGQIQNIDSGIVIYINNTTLFGETAVVNCSYGYEPLETQEITCHNNGSWSHYQTCALIRCPSVLGSNIYIANSTANYSFEDSAIVACAAGYTLDGSNVIECKVDGNWTDIPTCSLINCSSPIIVHGNVTFVTTSNGSTATVTCEYGYMHDGNGSALCENGTWLGIGSCETITCNPFMPQKNMRTQNDSNGEIYPFNSVIQVECDEGYQFTTNDTTLTCDLTGNWTVLPECEKIMCTIQNVSNGRPNPDKVMFLIGELYNLTCDEGYDLLDESNVTCDENGMWNKQLSCEPVNCTGDISLENGTFSPSKLFYSYGNEVSINCNEGFKVEGSSEIQCLANGSWSHLPSCTVITCADISVPENAEIVDDGGNTFGSNTTIKCKPGFYLTGINTSMCMDDENWLELGNCSLIECGTIPFIENTRNISANFTRQYNSSISYECDEGYNFSNESDAQIVCSQNGMWEGSISCQKVKCLKLNIGNGSISDETNVVFEFGDIVQVQCNDNYTLTGNSEVRCLANGSWDDVPVCEQNVVCPTLTITNGNIKFMDRRANVTCFDLYNLNSSSNVDCQQNGSWTEIPKCDLAFCQPITIEHGYLNDSQTEIGSVVHVSCSDGYKVNGTAITICENDGSWSAEVVCELVSCISFDVVERGLFTVDNTTAPFNGSIIPTCIPGTDFTPGSVREINCTENGWIGAPECQIQGQISFERDMFAFPSGQEAVIKCIISNNPNWQHAVMKKKNGETIFSVWNDTGSVRVTDEISIHTYTAFHSLESTFEFGLNISSIICDDAGIYICEVEAGNFTIVKSANASVSLTGNATIPNISAPEFMNAGHGGEIKCTGNVGLNENGLTGNLSLVVTTGEMSNTDTQEINPQCDGYVEAVFMAPTFPSNITEVTVRCETSTVEGPPLVSSNRTIEIRSSYVAFPTSSYLLKIGQPGNIVCDVANIDNWTAVVISKPNDADFVKVFPDGANNLQNGSNVDLSHSNLTDTAVKVVVYFNNVSCSDAPMESGTINYTCTALNGDVVLGQDTTKITFQMDPNEPILSIPLTTVENIPTPYTALDYLWCLANVGSDTNRVVQIEIQRSGESEFSAFNLTMPEPPETTSRNCEINVTVTYKQINFDNSYNNSKIRCSVYQNASSTDPMVSSPVYDVTLLPESICDEVTNTTNTTLYLPYPYSYPGSCRKHVECSFNETSVSIYARECDSDICPVFDDNGTIFNCDNCIGCI
ncbi:sushi, von Willebrand factor type A, EGF and pentraxin domain-containing protein 1-like isoform X2 [Mya arenaria]|uniref:sushi, von Willebrand factor type A, EGF and pentraxin domain-containing protein 1-like isoform X2 n=1 Tax=Mya arenaria TaxID=6604 RepID=UPI0022E02DA7|nr:sushi, von Willebrand factor type A, EGF and pentraxin domain-containing protein 1-like isoform X2 [Mya arenaria]